MIVVLLIVGAVVIALVSYTLGLLRGYDLAAKIDPKTMDGLLGKKADR